MPRQATFDFTGAPPATGGQGGDYVTPGRYAVRVFSVEDGSSANGKRMVTARFDVAEGEMAGRRLIDRFVLGGESNFGLRRLHAFLLSLALPVKEKQQTLDLDKLTGRTCEVQVKDDYQEASADGKYAARTTSKVDSYYFPEAAKAAPVAAKAAAPAPAPAAELDIDEPAVAVTASAAVTAPTEDVDLSGEIDDLFK